MHLYILNNIEPICKICNKEFKTLDPIGFHLKICHNMSIKDYYDMYFKRTNEGICLSCGKETEFRKLKYGYRLYCSRKCAELYIKNRVEEACINKYGVKSTFQLKEVKEKRKKTFLEKYGVENPAQNIEIKEKIKQTCINLYGVDNYTKTNEYKLKTKNTCLEKYGVENPFQSNVCMHNARKRYLYDNKQFDSSWELAYYIWLKDHNIDFEYHSISIEYTYNNKKHYYFPDFKIKNELYEIKADYFLDKNKNLKNVYKTDNKEKLLEKTKCMKNNNVKILTYKDIKPILDYINEKYGKNFLKKFKNNEIYPAYT